MKLNADQMMTTPITDREWAIWYLEDILELEFPDNYNKGPTHIGNEQSRTDLLWLRYFGIERSDSQSQVMMTM